MLCGEKRCEVYHRCPYRKPTQVDEERILRPTGEGLSRLTFDNGERRMLDCSTKLSKGSIFQKVAAPEDFNRVFVDENGNLAWDIDPTVDSTKVWNNRIDFCRDACYLESTEI